MARPLLQAAADRMAKGIANMIEERIKTSYNAVTFTMEEKYLIEDTISDLIDDLFDIKN